MRFLVVYAHPKEDSYQSAIHRGVVEALTQAGHQVDDCDLYAEGFQPILGHTELSRYPDGSQNRSIAPREVERLLRCEGLVFVFPTWCDGMPAILKGYFDRVWLPGVAFEISGSRTIPLLTSIVRLGVVTTFGSPWWVNNLYLGNPNRKILMRGSVGFFRHMLEPYGLLNAVWITSTRPSESTFCAMSHAASPHSDGSIPTGRSCWGCSTIWA